MLPPASLDHTASTEPFWRRTFHVLRRHPAFARYMGGTGVSLVGTWMQVAAQGYVVSTLTDKASVLGWINLANGLPMLLLTVAGGSVADRYDKRRVLLFTQFVQAALAVLIVSHRLAIWHVAAIAALLGVAAAFEVPADSALVPELVDKDAIRSPSGWIARFSMPPGSSARRWRAWSSPGLRRRRTSGWRPAAWCSCP